MDYSSFLLLNSSGMMADMKSACLESSFKSLWVAKEPARVARRSIRIPFINTTEFGSPFSTFGLDAKMIMPPPVFHICILLKLISKRQNLCK